MLSPSPKIVRLPKLFGIPSGLILCGVATLVVTGVVAAMALDRMTQQERSKPSATVALVPAEIFALPEATIVRNANSDARPPWLRHAAPFTASASTPRLSIVVTDDGSDATAALSAMRLRAPITLAIAPTADSAVKRAEAARRYGQEVLLLLPMQAEARFDTTPNPIAIHVPREELKRRMSWNLAQLDGYVGVMNRFGEATTRDAETMRAVMEVVKDEGLAFVDARTHDDSVGSAVARRMGVPAGDRNVVVPPGADAAELGAKLAVGMRHAERWGSAIVTLPAERRLISALGDWIGSKGDGVALAPVTATLKRLRSNSG